MFKCPECGAIFNEPVTKNAILDEDTGEEILLPKEMMIRVCPCCGARFKFDTFSFLSELRARRRFMRSIDDHEAEEQKAKEAKESEEKK